VLYRAKDLRGDPIIAKDGQIGSVDDLYFDDERWGLRYFVVDTGGWLPGRKVLISPASVDPEGSSDQAIRVRLTREQVERAPGADQDMPVSRQYEEAHARYYGYSYYWAGAGMWGAAAFPAPSAESDRIDREVVGELKAAEKHAAQSHLRSSAEVIGYRVEASDGKVGHLEDFMVDDCNWGVDAMIVDTTDWLPGGQVLVAPQAVERIDWQTRTVRLNMTREQVKQGAKIG
jgi:PRC-barrel domain